MPWVITRLSGQLFPVTLVARFCRTMNFNSPNLLHSHGGTHSWRFSTFYKISCFSTLFWRLIPSIFCHPLPTIFVLVPTSSEIWICRQSTIYSIVALMHTGTIWLCPGAGTFEILVVNHSPIPYSVAHFWNYVANHSPISILDLRYFVSGSGSR